MDRNSHGSTGARIDGKLQALQKRCEGAVASVVSTVVAHGRRRGGRRGLCSRAFGRNGLRSERGGDGAGGSERSRCREVERSR